MNGEHLQLAHKIIAQLKIPCVLMRLKQQLFLSTKHSIHMSGDAIMNVSIVMLVICKQSTLNYIV